MAVLTSIEPHLQFEGHIVWNKCEIVRAVGGVGRDICGSDDGDGD